MSKNIFRSMPLCEQRHTAGMLYHKGGIEMKKLIFAGLIYISLFSFAACGNTSDISGAEEDIMIESTTVVSQAFAQDYINTFFNSFFKAQDLEVLDRALKAEISAEQYRDYRDTTYGELQTYLDLDDDDLDALYNKEGLSSEKHDLLQENLVNEFEALPNSGLTEEEKLTRIVEILFKLKEMNRFDERSYDFDFLIADKQNLMPGLQFFLDFSELTRIEDFYCTEKHTCVISPFVTDVQIQGDVAKVLATVDDFAIYDDWPEPGISITHYEINFVANNGNWLILEIRSDDNVEAYYINNNIRIDIEADVQNFIDQLLETERILQEMEAANPHFREEWEAQQEQQRLGLEAAGRQLQLDMEAAQQNSEAVE